MPSNEIMQCTLILDDCCVVLGSLFGGSQDKFWNLLYIVLDMSFYTYNLYHDMCHMSIKQIQQQQSSLKYRYTESNCILLFLISRRKMISTAVGDCSRISQIYPYILLYRAIYLWYHSRITHPG